VRKKKMASNPRAKRALPVDDVGDWDEDRDNEEDEEEEGDAYDWSKPVLMEDSRDYGRMRGKQPQRDDGALHEDDGAAKLALEIEKKELKIMKKELAMQSRLHPARSHSSDEDSDRIGEEWVARRREPHHNSQMKAKRRAANKACREQFEERARDGKQKFVVDLDDNGNQFPSPIQCDLPTTAEHDINAFLVCVWIGS
jgi:hypothetical protein